MTNQFTSNLHNYICCYSLYIKPLSSLKPICIALIVIQDDAMCCFSLHVQIFLSFRRRIHSAVSQHLTSTAAIHNQPSAGTKSEQQAPYAVQLSSASAIDPYVTIVSSWRDPAVPIEIPSAQYQLAVHPQAYPYPYPFPRYAQLSRLVPPEIGICALPANVSKICLLSINHQALSSILCGCQIPHGGADNCCEDVELLESNVLQTLPCYGIFPH